MESTKRLAMIGGGGLNPELESVNRELLRHARSDHPRVTIMMAVERNAVEFEKQIEPVRTGLSRQFENLGAVPSFFVLRARDQAEDQENVALIRQADFIYIYGGKPDVYLEFLRDSAVWRETLTAFQNGAMLVGTSAGAVILCEACIVVGDKPNDPLNPMPLPDVWSHGFNIVPGIGVVPHFSQFPRQWADNLVATRPSHITMVGIDEITALLNTGDAWQVVGKGNVTLITASGSTTYHSGDAIQSFS
jgi:cyanophycinase